MLIDSTVVSRNFISHNFIALMRAEMCCGTAAAPPGRGVVDAAPDCFDVSTSSVYHKICGSQAKVDCFHYGSAVEITLARSE